MKRILLAFLAGLFFISLSVSTSAAEDGGITIAEDGKSDFVLAAPVSWRMSSGNDEICNDIVSAIKELSGAEITISAGNLMVKDKEIVIGYYENRGAATKRAAAGDLAFLDPELTGPLGWAVITQGTRIYMLTATEKGNSPFRSALSYFISNVLKYDSFNPPAEPSSVLVVPEVKYIHSDYLDCDSLVGITIGGADISEFTLYCPEDASEVLRDEAMTLRRFIYALTGCDVGLSSEYDPSAEGHAILFGLDSHSKKAPSYAKSVLEIRDGDLVIDGRNDEGIINAADEFYMNYLKISGRRRFEGEGDISIDSIKTDVSSARRMTSQLSDSGKMFRHSVAALLGTNETPCFSDEKTVSDLISAIRSTEPAYGSTVYVVNNTSKYCDCEKCAGGTDAFFSAVNTIAKDLSKDGITVATLSYRETAKAPSFALEDNVLVYFAAPQMCCAHALDDASCADNSGILSDLRTWKDKATVYVLDYSQDYGHYPSTFPNFGMIRNNAAVYAADADGVVYVWEQRGAALEFGELRHRLIETVIADAGISEDNYKAAYDGIVKEIYADDADAICRYIDLFTDKSADHFTIKDRPSVILPIEKNDGGEYVLDTAKELYSIWKGIYRRHDAPTEQYTGLKAIMYGYQLINSEERAMLHARVQFTAWLRDCVTPLNLYSTVFGFGN